MALCLLRSRLSAGRSFATGVAKAAVSVSGGTNTRKPVSYLGNVRRFSAGAGNTNNNSAWIITRRCLIAAACGLAFGQSVRNYVDNKSSTLSEETKAELLRYVDGKFSEAQGLITKSFQDEARAGVVQSSRQHVDSVFSRLQHDLRAETRAELARILKQSDDSAERNSQVLAQRRAAEEKKLTELANEIAQVHGEVRSCDRKLNSALVQQNSRVVADEGKYAELRSEFGKLRQEFQRTDWKLNTALSQVSSDEKKLAELTKEIKQIQGEVRSCDRKLDSALVQRNSRSANEGDYAELRQEFQKTDRKLKTALSQVSSRTATEGMSADCRNEVARLSQEIRNTDRKLNAALSQMNSRAASEGNFDECSSEIARMRQKMSRLERAVDRLVEESRKSPSDPGVGPSGPKAKKYKQD